MVILIKTTTRYFVILLKSITKPLLLDEALIAAHE
jgi:hypothetical protein